MENTEILLKLLFLDLYWILCDKKLVGFTIQFIVFKITY